MELLSVRDWATAHGVSYRTAYYWANNGKIPIIKKKVMQIRIASDVPPPVKSR